VPCTFQATTGQAVLDQIRTVDKTRLVKRLRRIDADTAEKVVRKLQEMVAL
jgi:mRNA interferase MazF